MNILFWNTYQTKNRENIDSCLVEMILEKDCDIIILAEYSNTTDQICKVLSNMSKHEYV